MQVLVLSRKGGRKIPLPPGIRGRAANFSSAESLEKVFAFFRPDAVVHAAATGMEIPRPSFFELVDTNIMLAHSLGNPFNLDVVTALCKKYNLWLVED